jgi:hypothetical protein
MLMLRKFLLFSICISMALSFNACAKKEETPKPPPGAPQMPGMMPPGRPMMPPPGVVVPKGEGKIVVPDSVKGKWKAVVIIVEDRMARTTKEHTLRLKSEFIIPNSKIKLQIGDFLPDFRMDGDVRTSASNSPNNPALNVKVYEDGKEIWKGWLYSKFPAIHPFQHERYSLTLKEGVPTT